MIKLETEKYKYYIPLPIGKADDAMKFGQVVADICRDLVALRGEIEKLEHWAGDIDYRLPAAEDLARGIAEKSGILPPKQDPEADRKLREIRAAVVAGDVYCGGPFSHERRQTLESTMAAIRSVLGLS